MKCGPLAGELAEWPNVASLRDRITHRRHHPRVPDRPLSALGMEAGVASGDQGRNRVDRRALRDRLAPRRHVAHRGALCARP